MFGHDGLNDVGEKDKSFQMLTHDYQPDRNYD